MSYRTVAQNALYYGVCTTTADFVVDEYKVSFLSPWYHARPLARIFFVRHSRSLFFAAGSRPT